MTMELASNEKKQFQTINEVIDVMTDKLQILQKNEDYRVVFHHVYLLMTKEMKKRLSSDFFLDPVWMERVLVGFSHYYFKAVDAYETGHPCPPAWELAFRLASEKQTVVLQDALLGINAHINNDLPLVTYDILKEDHAWPDARIMLRRRNDHDRINVVLHDLVDLVQEELAHHYGRFIHMIDYLMGRRDESLSSFIMKHCRTNVWHNTELLLDATDDHHWDIQRRKIENNTYKLGIKIADTHSFKFIKYLAPLARKNRWF